jgi:hypothetical protein
VARDYRTQTPKMRSEDLAGTYPGKEGFGTKIQILDRSSFENVKDLSINE